MLRLAEQIRGEQVDQRADLFSLGIMLFEMLTGHLPFNSTNEASAILGIISEEPANLALYLDEIPPGLQHMVSRALAKDTADRYQSTAEFQEDIQSVRAGQATGLKITTRFATTGRRLRRRLSTRLTAGISFVASLALVALLAIQFSPNGQNLPGRINYSGESPNPTILVKPDRSGDSPTIQAALNTAAPGDTILLADGIYTGPGNKNIHFPAKSLTLMSRSDDPALCIIDCEGHKEQEAFGFRLNFPADNKVVIKGITIANSWIKASGGALAINNNAPTIANCVFKNNEIAKGRNGTGGAVMVGAASFPEFLDCVFENNRAADAGGGINFAVAGGRVIRCVFRDNWALHGGSGIYMGQSEVEIRDCLFTGNNCGPGNWGSSLHFDRVECRGVVINCTFSGDRAPDEVIFARRGASPTIKNCLIAFNGPGVALNFEGTPVTIEGCNIFGNQGGDWVGELTDWDLAGGNFSADPMFCNLPGDSFALGSGSPCLPENNSTGSLVGALGQGCLDRSLITVPDDFATIAAALRAAVIGDTVLVYPGTWNEHGLRPPAGVTLRGATGDPADVVIDARQQGRVILCDSLQIGVRLEDLTITGGLATGTYPDDRGGGIACFSTSIEVNNCLITGNEAYDGGGIFSQYGAAIHLCGCGIISNLAAYSGGGYSGRNCNDIVFTDCLFSDNQTPEYGGGLRLKNSMAMVEQCTIENNSARDGSAALSQQSTTHFFSCLIIGNDCPNNNFIGPQGSGALGFSIDSGSRLTNCTLAGNRIGTGTGAISTYNCDLLVTHTIVYGSLGGSSIRTSGWGQVNLACSNLFANQGRDYIQRLEGLEGKNGNLSMDPLFVDVDGGDFRLQLGSPCIAEANPGCGLIGALPGQGFPSAWKP